MQIRKKHLIGISGFVWGLAGFAVELPSETLQLIFRTSFIIMGLAIILSVLKFKIKSRYYIVLGLFIIYLIAYLTTSFIHEVDISGLFREILLILVVFALSILFSSQKYVLDFLRGIFMALLIMLIYFFFNIDFLQITTSFYRLNTGMGANGIGSIATMLFAVSYYYIFSIETSSLKKYLFVLIALMSLMVVIATGSRTSLAMLFIGFIVINIYYNNRRILVSSVVFLTFLVFWKFDIIEQLLRLETPEGYTGGKNIYNLTGRTELWSYGVDVIKENILFGVGTKDNFVMVDGHRGSYHNAYVQIMVTMGLFGIIPTLLIILLAFRSVVISKKLFLLKAIFLIGFVGSMAESRLFNFGSPANFFFLISIIYLLGTKYTSRYEKIVRSKKNMKIIKGAT